MVSSYEQGSSRFDGARRSRHSWSQEAEAALLIGTSVQTAAKLQLLPNKCCVLGQVVKRYITTHLGQVVKRPNNSPRCHSTYTLGDPYVTADEP
jgi:hypothetical protein